MINIRVGELRDIPASIFFGEGDDYQTESLIVPIVILQQQILGIEALDEDPVLQNGIPHPVSQQGNFHPNQHNHFGPYSAT